LLGLFDGELLGELEGLCDGESELLPTTAALKVTDNMLAYAVVPFQQATSALPPLSDAYIPLTTIAPISVSCIGVPVVTYQLARLPPSDTETATAILPVAAGFTLAMTLSPVSVLPCFST
jgi:hypothetical protein